MNILNIRTSLFSPKLLNNIDSSKQNWFSAENELGYFDAHIAHKFPPPSYSQSIQNNQSFKILLKTPFILITILFLQSMYNILIFFGLGRKKKFLALKFLSLDLEISVQQIFNKIYWGKQLLVPSFNCYCKKARYLAFFDDIERKNIQNPLIKEYMNKSFSKIRFNLAGKGLCHGSVNWFNYLFLKGIENSKNFLKPHTTFCSLKDFYKFVKAFFIQGDFSDWNRSCVYNKNCLQKGNFEHFFSLIASLFKDGQPVQSGIFQSLYGIAGPLLGVTSFSFIFEQEVLISEKKFINGINTLPFGIYDMSVFGVHSMSLFKTGHEYLVYDPNIGLIKLNKAEELLSEILKSHLDKAKVPKVVFHSQFHMGKIQKWGLKLFLWYNDISYYNCGKALKFSHLLHFKRNNQ